MIDVSEILYYAIAVSSKGKQYCIQDYIQDLGWEENKGELSMRSSFTVRNDKTSKGRLSSILKPGVLIVILASTDGGKNIKEVGRGYVTVWNPDLKNSGDDLKCTNYDELYNLQKSQENRYFSKGTKTKTAVQRIFRAWKIPIGKYKGPNVKHGKKKYEGKGLSDEIMDLLDDAKKKGGEECVVRAESGKTSVLPHGSNDTVYVFDKNCTVNVRHSRSAADLVTRVRVVSRADDEKKSKVQATVNGFTKYGVRQRIYTRNSDESLKDAKKAAQEILDEKGDLEKTIILQAPDVPYIRKGDVVYVKIRITAGYYNVVGIRHDAGSCSMTMELEYSEKNKISKNKKVKKSDFRTGDTVNFKGGRHYVSCKKGAKGHAAKAGKAKIAKTAPGKAHPYRLVHVSRESNVNGWVDEGTFF